MRKVLFPLVVIIAPSWSVHSLIVLRAQLSWNLEDSLEFNQWKAMVLIHILICLLSMWIGAESLLQIAHRNRHGSALVLTKTNRYRALLMSGLVLAAHQPTQDPQAIKVPEEESIPIGMFLTPSIATLLINDLLRRRREQIQRQVLPDVLSEKEQILLADVQELAKKDAGHFTEEELNYSNPIVQTLTSAVERDSADHLEAIENPLLVVRLYGYPEVCGVNGQSATFRKKRALELVVWLSLNRDRPRRSAARTALWQVDVSDSTFSTIVSDMRRGIADVASELERSELVPTTYSDEIALSKRVTTDYQMLRDALQKFREEPENYKNLVRELRGIRDAPFSGTAYEWADLDGTTTRLIITAMQAAHELAEYALSVGDVESVLIAVSAGLRVMPGDEELLQIQSSFVMQNLRTRL